MTETLNETLLEFQDELQDDLINESKNQEKRESELLLSPEQLKKQKLEEKVKALTSPVSATQFYPSKRELLDNASNSTNQEEVKSWLVKLQGIQDHYEGKEVINSQPTLWKTFPKLKDAFAFQGNLQQESCIFSYEEKSGKGRYFLITNYESFLKRYMKIFPEERHFYEIIPQDTPCRLYFDLEFQKAINKNSNGEEMIQFFKKFVAEQIFEKYQIKIDETHVIDLCSTTPEKFSRHLIFHIPNLVFLSNLHAGYFVRELINTMKIILNSSSHDHYQSVSKLIIVKENEMKDFFIDTGVYTKNRSFRVYLSSKYGKNTYLTVASTNKFPIKSEEQFFLDSLICSVKIEQDTKVISYQSNVQSISFPSSMTDSAQFSKTLSQQGQTSPYPKIDSFVKDYISQTGPCFIRSALYYPESQTLIYHIGGNRYCHNIGRQHKSNHVSYLVDLKWGLLVQKCLDPDCQKLESKADPVPLPKEINPLVKNDENDVDITDEDLRQAIEQNPEIWE